MTLPQRFWDKVKTSKTNFYDGTPCLEWTAYTNNGGYGIFGLNGINKKSHRLSYEDVKGKIPKELELDHLCRTRCCVNPDHLEAVTRKENMKRGLTGFLSGLKQRLKTHCPQDHEYSLENTYIRPNGERICRTCDRIKHKDNRQRKKLEKLIVIG